MGLVSKEMVTLIGLQIDHEANFDWGQRRLDFVESELSSAHHCSQSLSRFSHRLLALGTDGFNEAPATLRGRFVNTI
ncbi:hypothetical protein TorRG33x02_304580 [Trema orientale]|uniref:Uncharacterized protein n=1 Tax=Trema orientale TaxID=63057 RepID=A0A2P5BY37_TREOI|nr:hypothetical protein TorRG33x02_304580 [Trema orientale]